MEYEDRLKEMSDEALRDEVESKVWLSSFAANNPRSRYHDECDATWRECQRREKPWLYQRGWNRAYASFGYTPSDRDIEMATPDYYKAA